jgi:hypothetical protein
MIILIIVAGLAAGLIYILMRNSIGCAPRRGLEQHRRPAKRRHDLVPNLVEAVKRLRHPRAEDVRERDQAAARRWARKSRDAGGVDH